ncbi:MAG: Xaa-Pro peptidase family protein [Eubacteriales bacterium]
MNARLSIPREEYNQRIVNVQKEMQTEGIDLLIAHACECESANVRYLTNFWAVFDFVGVLVPREGKPILLTGGPESYDFAKEFAQIDDIRVHPMYVETSAPEFDKPADAYNFTMILNEINKKFPVKKIGIANPNIIPAKIMQDLQLGAGDGVSFVDAHETIMRCRWKKSKNEIALLREAYRITELGVMKAIDFIQPGVREWEVEAAWRGEIYKLGAEGTSYSVWVTSGPSTFQSLCKSSDRVIEKNSMVQLSLGAKYAGYCGNMCRGIVLGKISDRHIHMMQVCLDCMNDTIAMMRPGVTYAEVYNKFMDKLKKQGFEGLNLYGPAHGTGLQEVDGPWVDNRNNMVFEPNMVFNIDIWVADSEYGIRYEDGVLVTENGMEQLSSFGREIVYR